jgi:hypothetical protein
VSAKRGIRRETFLSGAALLALTAAGFALLVAAALLVGALALALAVVGVLLVGLSLLLRRRRGG